MLYPLSAIFWLVTATRNWCYDKGVFRTTSFDIPIISVGNLAVGGSGKTPLVEHLIAALHKNYTIAVLSRGYGRKTRGFRWVETQYATEEVGDEPLQIKTKFETVCVAVCEDRVKGIKRIVEERPDINLVLLDDAFQHRAITPLLHLVLSTYSHPYFRDFLLPVGRLRESRTEIKRADALIFTKCPDRYAPYQNKEKKTTFYAKMVYQKTEIAGAVVGFSGLANNALFTTFLADNYALRNFKEFKDHYSFKQKDIDALKKKARGATLVCTEKDWIKIKYLKGVEQIKHIKITNEVEGGVAFVPWLIDKIHAKQHYTTHKKPTKQVQ